MQSIQFSSFEDHVTGTANSTVISPAVDHNSSPESWSTHSLSKDVALDRNVASNNLPC